MATPSNHDIQDQENRLDLAVVSEPFQDQDDSKVKTKTRFAEASVFGLGRNALIGLVVILFVALVLVRNQFVGDIPLTIDEKWREDWGVFVTEVARVVKSGGFSAVKHETMNGAPIGIDAKAGKDTLQGQLFDYFTGSVRWRGKVYELARGELGVEIAKSDVNLPGGFVLPGTVWVRLKSQPSRALNPGDEVIFHATLQRPTDRHPFSGILIIAETLVMKFIDGEVE